MFRLPKLQVNPLGTRSVMTSTVNSSTIAGLFLIFKNNRWLPLAFIVGVYVNRLWLDDAFRKKTSREPFVDSVQLDY